VQTTAGQRHRATYNQQHCNPYGMSCSVTVTDEAPNKPVRLYGQRAVQIPLPGAHSCISVLVMLLWYPWIRR